MLHELPGGVLYTIAAFLNKEDPFYDKVDIAINASALRLAGCGALANELIYRLDPLSENGQLTSKVLKNLKNKRNQLISTVSAKETWNLTDDDIGELPMKRSIRNNKITNLCKLQDVKRISANKFSNNYENLFAKKVQKKNCVVLQSLLLRYNVGLRIDSKICQMYIKTGKGNPEDIAKLLKEMEFYHIYTNYESCFSSNIIKYHLDYGYYDRDHISMDAKQQALREFINENPQKLEIIPKSIIRFLE